MFAYFPQQMDIYMCLVPDNLEIRALELIDCYMYKSECVNMYTHIERIHMK